MLNRILFKLYVFFIGFRCYMTSIDEDDVQYNSVTMPFLRGPDMVFKFYRTEIEYTAFRWGRITKLKRIRYGVAMDFSSDEHPALKNNYHGKLMTFFVPYADTLSEESISKFLWEKYMDYIMKQLRDARPDITAGPDDNGLRRRFDDRSSN